MVRKGCDDWPRRVVETTLFRNLRSLGTVCYSISPRGARRLFEVCTPLRPLDTFHPGINRVLPNSGIDNVMAHAAPFMDAFVSVPPLVLTENDRGASTVQDDTEWVAATEGPRSNLLTNGEAARPAAAFA
jgi:hypothetical protein